MNTTTKQEIKPGYKKTPIGIIPEDWEVKKLGYFLNKIIGGGTPSRSNKEYWNGDIPWATVKDYATFNPKKTQEYITEKGLKNSSSNLIPAKTLITATRMGLGKVSIYDVDVAINQDLKALFPNDSLDRNYLYHWFIMNEKYIESLGNGSTVKGITLDDLKALKFYEIPLEEQKSIANCLSTWDSGIEKLTQLIQAKKQRKKGLMQQIFNGQLTVNNGQLERVENQEDWLKGWEEVRLGEIGETFNGLTGKTKDDFGEGSPYVSYLNVFNNNSITETTKFDFVQIKEGENQTRLKYGDLIFTTSSETPNEVGMSGVILFNPKQDLFLNSFCFGLRLANFEKIEPNFAAYLLRGKQFRKEMYKLAQGSTRFNLSKTGFRKINLIVPPVKKQTAIAKILQSADKEIELLEQKLSAMQEQKKGLMQVLLTGEKRLVNNEQ